MKCSILIVWLFVLSTFSGCLSNYNCESPFKELLINDIRLDSIYSVQLKILEIEEKNQLIDAFCSKLLDQKELLIIEMRSENIYGLVYTIDNKKMFTFKQSEKEVLISDDSTYDKYGNLNALFHSLDLRNLISNLEKKEYEFHLKPKKDDIYQFRIYYLDLKGKLASCYFF